MRYQVENLSIKRQSGIGVEGEKSLLSHTDFIKLSLLQVDSHPEFLALVQGKDILARLQQIAGNHPLLGYQAIDR